MKHELKFMFEFQSLINEMQGKIIEYRMKGADEKTISDSLKRIDKLIEIYKHFDAYYYQAHFAQQKIFKLEEENLSLLNTIDGLSKAKEQLLKAAQWN